MLAHEAINLSNYSCITEVEIEICNAKDSFVNS